MWRVCLDTHICCVQGTMCCDTGGLPTLQPAPPTIKSPAAPKVQRLSDHPSPRKVTEGSVFPWGRGREGWPGLQRPRGDPCLSSTNTFPLPGPTLPAHSPGMSFQESTDVQRRLPVAPQPTPPLPCPVPAEPSLLPGSASVGNSPGHLYSPPRVNCLVSSLPIHCRVTLP